MTKHLFIILIVSLIIGCTMLIEPKVRFILRNDSSFDMKIRFFQKSKILDSIDIKSKKQYVSEKFDSDHEGKITPFETNSDSIIIEFSNRKYLVQYCDGEKLHFNFTKCGKIPKSLMDFGLGNKKLLKFSENYYLTLTFNNSDAEKAIPL